MDGQATPFTEIDVLLNTCLKIVDSLVPAIKKGAPLHLENGETVNVNCMVRMAEEALKTGRRWVVIRKKLVASEVAHERVRHPEPALRKQSEDFNG